VNQVYGVVFAIKFYCPTFTSHFHSITTTYCTILYNTPVDLEICCFEYYCGGC
jgi:hypothetical protein